MFIGEIGSVLGCKLNMMSFRGLGNNDVTYGEEGGS
jgi:hypothetical protein